MKGDRLIFLTVAALAAGGLALTFLGPRTAEADLVPADPGAAAVAAAGDALFGSYRRPAVPPGGLPGVTDPDRLRAGRATYALKCAQCHGPTGAADTGTARLLEPPPRSFRHGVIKFTSTAAGRPPLREDLIRVVREGIPTTAMAGFGSLPPAALEEIADYLTWLLVRGAAETAAAARLAAEPAADPGRLLAEELDRIVADWRQATAAEPPTPEPPRGPGDRRRGAELFVSAGCASCHGEDGGGRGPAAFHDGRWLLRDEWGHEARPRAFARDGWFGGGRPVDLWRRIAFGVKGTPMPAHADKLDPDRIWSLVHYVQYLAGEEELP
ncbi:MAG: hypothetical protein D6702_05355 [Planctomycetota bacterium]|nr:MAG: hypothetical protein D6702_05355 [Planctomycetota bacterium]